ncbi:MAG: glycosyltransferase family 2 protein [Alphaproteobacteria bacterium]|nr:glycosyltransferase family 2 protein [Alphaproteobacteria bacterium]
MPKVSVLMSAYNTGKYIAEAIESILAQTFSDFEFIIINDGSRDDTAEVVRKYAAQDSRIIFIDNPVNRGLVPCLNQGLELCRGEYIARMDSDDIAMPNRFEIEVNYLDNNPDVGVVGGWHEAFGNNIKPLVRKYPLRVHLLDMLTLGAPMSQPTAMLRTSVMRANNIKYNPNFPYAEDYEFWANIVRYTKVHNLPIVMIKYRIHGNNVSIMAHKTQVANANIVRNAIIQNLTNSDRVAKKLREMTYETISRVWIFGILPIIRKKQYGIGRTKYYLMERIPLVMIKNGSIYLFHFIKIGKVA